MIKSWTSNYFLTVLGFLLLLYILWAVSNGTFDISQWVEDARNSYGILGGFGSIFILILKTFIN
jgi:hypothetical protein